VLAPLSQDNRQKKVKREKKKKKKKKKKARWFLEDCTHQARGPHTTIRSFPRI
jgi:hypothetical protein